MGTTKASSTKRTFDCCSWPEQLPRWVIPRNDLGHPRLQFGRISPPGWEGWPSSDLTLTP